MPGDPAAGYQQGGTWVTGLTDLVGSPLGYVDAGHGLGADTVRSVRQPARDGMSSPWR
jgi:hypothetical protein